MGVRPAALSLPASLVRAVRGLGFCFYMGRPFPTVAPLLTRGGAFENRGWVLSPLASWASLHTWDMIWPCPPLPLLPSSILPRTPPLLPICHIPLLRLLFMPFGLECPTLRSVCTRLPFLRFSLKYHFTRRPFYLSWAPLTQLHFSL